MVSVSCLTLVLKINTVIIVILKYITSVFIVLKNKSEKNANCVKNHGKQGEITVYLKSFQEIMGNLKSIEGNENDLILNLTHDYEIHLPPNSIPIKKLKNLIGKNIGIINIDGNYEIRKIK